MAIKELDKGACTAARLTTKEAGTGSEVKERVGRL